MKRTIFYPGSFDPVTFGHIDIIRRAQRIADRLVVGVGAHHEKRALFTVAERKEMLQEVCQDAVTHGFEIEIVSFDNLAVDAARTHGADLLLRGARDTTDFAYEMQMAGMNANIGRQPTGTSESGGIDSVFLAASPEFRHIAAKFVRQIAAMGGDVSAFVPAQVAQRLAQKFAAR